MKTKDLIKKLQNADKTGECEVFIVEASDEERNQFYVNTLLKVETIKDNNEKIILIDVLDREKSFLSTK